MTTLAGEAEGKGAEAAEFAVSDLLIINPPIHAIVVGSRTHTKAVALRDTALSLNDPRILVELVDPGEDSERLATLGYSKQEVPFLVLASKAYQSEAVSDPARLIRFLKI